MKAFALNKYGSIEDACVQTDITAPTISKPDQVLVRVAASAVNPFDNSMCRGYGKNLLNFMRWMINGEKGVEGKEFPLILGREFSGVVELVGDSVVKFKRGDEVYGTCVVYQNGAMAEYVVVSQTCIGRKPANLSFVEAASLPYAGLTFWSASVGKDALTPDTAKGKRVLIHAGTGGVGSMAIQMVKAWGGYVATTCSTSGVKMVTQLGADEIIDYTRDELDEVLKDAPRFDYILYTLRSDAVLNKSLSLLTPGGVLATLQSPMMHLTTSHGVVMGLCMSAWNYALAYFGQRLRNRFLYWSYYRPNEEALEVITQMVEKKQIIPQVEKVFSLDNARDAYKHVAEGHARGKTVVVVTQMDEGVMS